MPIKNRITEIRGKETRRAFAKRIEIAENTLRNYEEGLSLPNSDVIATICRATGASAAWLIFGTGPMRPAESAPATPDNALASQPMPQPAPKPMPDASPAAPPQACARCSKLDAELEAERGERRALAAENRELTTEVRHLWKENGELREKCARLEERQYQRSGPVDSEQVGHAG